MTILTLGNKRLLEIGPNVTMSDSPLDAVDRRILYLLQEDARYNTATEIAKQLDVSTNTVRNRIERLEEEGVVRGYNVDLDYAEAGFRSTTSSCVPPGSANAKGSSRTHATSPGSSRSES